MDVKCAFLNGVIQEEVYVEQPPGFESNTFTHYVSKLYKALYELNQDPRAWYAHLSSFLLNNGFEREKVIQLYFARTMTPNLY